MAEKRTGTRSSRSGNEPEVVSGLALARHLDCSRSYVDKLEGAGVFRRRPGGGYDLTEARTSYIRHLRRERAQSPKNEAEQAFLKERTVALQVRTAQRLGELFPRAVALAIIDDYIAAATIELQNIPARAAGGDLVTRKRVERAVHEARGAISDRLAAKARQALPEVAADAAD